MKPTRQTQPYRADRARTPSSALTAMLRGRTAGGWNPKDVERAAPLLAAGKRRGGRPARPARGQRPARTPR